MTHDDLFAIFAIAAVLTSVGVAVAVLRKSGQKRFETLAPAFDFGSSSKVGLFATTVEGIWRGYTCRYTIEPASQYSPGGARLSLAVSAAGRWSAERATAGSRFMVQVGVLQDHEIGDPDLDRQLRVTAEEPGSVESVFGIEGVRTAIRNLLESENFTAVRLGKRGLEVRWSPRDRKLDEDVATLRRRLEAAVDLASMCGYPPRLGT